MRRVLAFCTLALSVVGAGSCGDGAGPVAGLITVSLTTPNPGGDGAILLTVAGPATPTSVSAEPGLRVFSMALSTTNQFAVTGSLANGAILRIGVPDVRRANQYAATVQGVAANDYSLRTATSTYKLTVVAP
jgi:hypothetical protein